ncbi:MAG: hypothetical protein JKY15_08910 [Deltaproteobacteria bacterium]|nr:hypothetical protein [Deltaproteobacteria bacterium]
MNAYDKERAIVIPLAHGDIEYEVNVTEYEKYGVKVKSGRGSQTDQIHKYTAENQNYVVNLWDSPGFIDSDGIEKDCEHAKKIVSAISSVSFNAIAVVLTPQDVDREDSDPFRASINAIRRMLPKSFSGNIIGVYNRATIMTNTDEVRFKKDFATLFKSADKLENRVYFVDGSSFFCNVSDASSRSRAGAKSNWEMDALDIGGILADVQKLSPVQGEEALEIQRTVDYLEGNVTNLGALISNEQSEKTNLALVENSLGHEGRRRDSNANYEKDFDEHWEEKVDNCYNQDVGCGWGYYYESRVRRVHYIDEGQRNEYNAAVQEITNLGNKKTDHKKEIGYLQGNQTETIETIVGLQKTWEELAMSTDLSPLIVNLERKIRSIEQDGTKTQEERDSEVASYRKVLKTFYEMRNRVHGQ